MKLWRKYVTKVARRYGSRLDYQIWPEPNIVQNWTGTPAPDGDAHDGGLQGDQPARRKKAKVVSPAVALRLRSSSGGWSTTSSSRVGASASTATSTPSRSTPSPRSVAPRRTPTR